MNRSQPSGILEFTPFYFYIKDEFEERTGLRPPQNVFVCTRMDMHAPVYSHNPETGQLEETDMSFMVKVLDEEHSLLLHHREMWCMNATFPDGICKHPLKDDFLDFSKLTDTVYSPLHVN